jgi:hypothetical protein
LVGGGAVTGRGDGSQVSGVNWLQVVVGVGVGAGRRMMYYE